MYTNEIVSKTQRAHSSTRTPSFPRSVQSNGGWYNQRVAERDAGFTEGERTLVCTCYLCGVGIGIGYVETCLYFCRVINTWIYDNADNYVYVEDAWIEACGGCAVRKEYLSSCLFTEKSYKDIPCDEGQTIEKTLQYTYKYYRAFLSFFSFLSGLSSWLKLLFFALIPTPEDYYERGRKKQAPLPLTIPNPTLVPRGSLRLGGYVLRQSVFAQSA